MISDQIHLSHSAFSIRWFELLLMDNPWIDWRKVGRPFVTRKPQENASMLIFVYVLEAVSYLPTLPPRNNCTGWVSPAASAQGRHLGWPHGEGATNGEHCEFHEGRPRFLPRGGLNLRTRVQEWACEENKVSRITTQKNVNDKRD